MLEKMRNWWLCHRRKIHDLEVLSHIASDKTVLYCKRCDYRQVIPVVHPGEQRQIRCNLTFNGGKVWEDFYLRIDGEDFNVLSIGYDRGGAIRHAQQFLGLANKIHKLTPAKPKVANA